MGPCGQGLLDDRIQGAFHWAHLVQGGGGADVDADDALTLTPAAAGEQEDDGGAGTEAIAKKIVEVLDSGEADYKPIYPDEMPLLEKIETIAREIYRADGVTVDSRVLNQLKDFEEEGFGHFPVCMAKPQYSFSADPT